MGLFGFWRQHPTKQQLYGHLPPITKTIYIYVYKENLTSKLDEPDMQDTAGEVGDEFISDVF